jgi:DNA-binding SARP family transcriptional activator
MHSLRQALSTLRKALGDDQLQPADVPCLLIVNDTVQWNPAKHIHVDVHEFTRRIGDLLASHRRANRRINLRQLRAAIAFYRGPFLASFSLPDSSAFDEWLLLDARGPPTSRQSRQWNCCWKSGTTGEYGEAARLAEQLSGTGTLG